MEACLAERSARPYLERFSSYARPVDIVCAYALYCRNKTKEAVELLDSFGLNKHILLDLGSLHLMLRQIVFWGDRRFLASGIPDGLAVPALIPARGNSKGIPKKNLAEVDGKSLLEIAVSKARQSRFITRVIVDTDNEDIANAARQAGAEVLYLRPDVLAGDFSDLSDVRILATHWLELMEGYWYDYLAVLTPPHPLWPVEELDKACESFIRSRHTSLVSVSPTEFPWDAFYHLEAGKAVELVKRKSPRIHARCGAFFLLSRKPNGHYGSPQFRKIYPAEFTSTVYPLSPEHAFDINTPEELAACRRLVKMQKHVGTLAGDACRAALDSSHLILPSVEDGPTVLLHYPDIDEEPAFRGAPAFLRLLAVLAATPFAGRYVVCGKSATARAVAEYYALPIISRGEVLKRNCGLMAPVRRELRHIGIDPGAVIVVNGYAGTLKGETLVRIVDVIDRDDKAFCTTLRPADHPPHWLLQEQGGQVLPLFRQFIGFRQKIETTYVESRLLVGFGRDADHKGSFTDHVLLADDESRLLTTACNLVAAGDSWPIAPAQQR